MMDGVVIKLFDSTGNVLIDSVSAEYEDSFCLDSFGDLIAQHSETEPIGTKSFIIARVQTWDPKQPEKAFFSYYNAYNLNKILFQTQVYLKKKLIHRLHVLNPLTNSDIIGNIQYFMVKGTPETTPKSLVNPMIPTDTQVVIQKPDSVIPAVPSVKPTLTVVTSIKIEPALNNESVSKSKRATPIITEAALSPTVREIESGTTKTWTLTSPVTCLLTEEEGPVMTTLSEKKRGGAVSEMLRKMSIMSVTKVERLPFQSPVKGDLPTVRTDVRPSDDTSTPNSTSPKKTVTFDASKITKPPTSPLKLQVQSSNRKNIEASKSAIESGSITRFSSPLSTDEIAQLTPKTAKARRRALSYQNAVAAAGDHASFEEWMEMIAEDVEETFDHSEPQDFDQVRPIKSSISPKSAVQATENNTYPAKSPPIELPPSPMKATPRSRPISTINAYLFATDEDYLESSKVRAVFRKNAISLEDVKLFELPEYTGEAETEPTMVIVIEEPPMICVCCCPSEEVIRNSSTYMKIYHQSKIYLAAIVILVGLFLFIFL
jgi:hypothetical protein